MQKMGITLGPAGMRWFPKEATGAAAKDDGGCTAMKDVQPRKIYAEPFPVTRWRTAMYLPMPGASFAIIWAIVGCFWNPQRINCIIL